MKPNLLWRRELRHKAEADEALRDVLMDACQRSFLFWCNAFVWTYRQKIVDADGNDIPITGPLCNVPFITWPVQDEAALRMIEAIRAGEDINFEKSRDMGASWLLLAVADWFFLWHKNANVGCVSRKEELVDKPGDMDTLFEKIRYIHRMLPQWQLPRIRDRFMFLHNLELNSSVSGESTNTEVGRGGRKTFYIVDEAAAISHGESVESSLSQNTACQIWASTPHGPNTQFHNRIIEHRGRLIQLPWWRHPEKAAGAHQIMDATGRVRWTSPWYERQTEKFSRKTIAQEIDMDHGQAGDMVFDYTELTRHRQDHQAEPMLRGELVWTEEMPEADRVQMIQQMDDSKLTLIPNHRKAPWRFWCKLIDGRPPQHWSYIFGIDISNGAGSSNSVISVLCYETGKIVAKWWDAYTSPEALAVLAAAAGVWFGGLRPPAFICWENNGPGGIFGRKLVGMGYPYFYRQRLDNTIKNSRTPRWGWHSNNERKEVLLGLYRDAMNRDDIIVPCKESLDEAADYIYDNTGSIIPSRLREETHGGRALHGDHVIADALTWLGRSEMPTQRKLPTRAPKGSYAYRRQQRKHREREEQNAWRP